MAEYKDFNINVGDLGEVVDFHDNKVVVHWKMYTDYSNLDKQILVLVEPSKLEIVPTGDFVYGDHIICADEEIDFGNYRIKKRNAGTVIARNGKNRVLVCWPSRQKDRKGWCFPEQIMRLKYELWKLCSGVCIRGVGGEKER